jgi:pSer/pThr/pTyr-binding forkhead associated (FHA) protein
MIDDRESFVLQVRRGVCSVFAGALRVVAVARITIQVLEGFERGRVFGDLPTPVTIGREEDNTIQLNDERVSRFHVKIQEDGGRIILTDLESTNGTRINGHPVQMRVLQYGDQLSIGRSILVYGSAGEIDGQTRGTPVAEMRGHETHNPDAGRRTVSAPDEEEARSAADESSSAIGDDDRELFPKGPPEIPAGLKMSQMAQLSDVLAYVHDQMALVVDVAVEDRQGNISQMRIDREHWQRLLKLEMQLASYLRQIADPQR